MASQVKLFESPDFYDAILAATAHFTGTGLTAQLIEKDYFVTEALRVIAIHWPNQIIFKGGTSLSKGWKLINRFSEDLDLFLNQNAFEPPLGASRTDKMLKSIEESVGTHPVLRYLSKAEKSRSRYERGLSRTSDFEYPMQFSGSGAIQNRVLLEMGIRSGDFPIESVELTSFLADFLQSTGESLGTEDEAPFSMPLLHFRRTFVEKLFSLHAKIIQYQLDGTSFSNYTRHYYDLMCLAQRPEVRTMLESEEYIDIKRDCDRISQKYFKAQYYRPPDLKFSESIAFFPTGELRQAIAKAYKQQCDNLCLSPYPSWEAVEQCFEDLREWL
ncbi:MAG: nucleotidyl transferase AbiEii/AbiGii toxin family protein [Thermosynechococcaceae cyanobacterium MS004]|nr:nucleotidyl transferase AbiEii/AbiGii toxin family protein [Thermosynechococcaceae cyanobacterium MS004]